MVMKLQLTGNRGRSMMKMICAWCGRNLGEKDGRGVEGISHCLCEECLRRIQVSE